MPYAQRDESGNINGLYANAQPGFAEEYLADDDPAVAAYLDQLSQPPPPSPSQEDVPLYDHENRLRTLEGRPPLGLSDFIAKKRGG
jgi:hypothetical protein